MSTFVAMRIHAFRYVKKGDFQLSRELTSGNTLFANPISTAVSEGVEASFAGMGSEGSAATHRSRSEDRRQVSGSQGSGSSSGRRAASPR